MQLLFLVAFVLSLIANTSGDESSSSKSKSNGSRDKSGGGAAKKENVCQVCETTGELLLCEGGCCGAFHLDCIGLQTMPNGTFKCDECISGKVLIGVNQGPFWALDLKNLRALNLLGPSLLYLPSYIYFIHQGFRSANFSEGHLGPWS